MKRWSFVAALATALTTVGHVRTEARQYQTCYKSPLCNGLFGFWALDEGSDYARVGEIGPRLLEKDGYNVANTTGKFGSAANFSPAGFDNNSRLAVRYGGSMLSGVFTVAMWVYPTNAGSLNQVQYLIDTRQRAGGYTSGPGFSLYFQNVSGSLKPEATVELDNSTQYFSGKNASLTVNAWNSVVAGIGFTADYSSGIVWVAVNGLWSSGTNLPAQSVKASAGIRDLLIAASQPTNTEPFMGRIDHLAFVGRQWDSDDYVAWHNGGNGRAWPFVTE